MKGLKLEHLVDSEPGYDFRFAQRDSEQDPYQQVFDVFHFKSELKQ